MSALDINTTSLGHTRIRPYLLCEKVCLVSQGDTPYQARGGEHNMKRRSTVDMEPDLIYALANIVGVLFIMWIVWSL